MRNRKPIRTATKVATASSNSVIRVNHSLTTDDRILALRKQLGMNVREAARDYKIRVGFAALSFALIN